MNHAITRINLLPYRDLRVRELRIHFFVIMGIVMGLGFMTVFGVNYFLYQFVDAQSARVDELKALIDQQDKEIAEIAKLKKQIELLIGRKSVIESLQDEKSNPIRILNAISKAIPVKGVYLESFVQNKTAITLNAISDGNATISTFISALENSNGVFRNVKLGASNQFDYGTQKFYRFSLSFETPIYKK